MGKTVFEKCVYISKGDGRRMSEYKEYIIRKTIILETTVSAKSKEEAEEMGFDWDEFRGRINTDYGELGKIQTMTDYKVYDIEVEECD